MQFKTGSIREIHHQLLDNGYHVSENSIRQWVKRGIVPAAYAGRKAYINYDAVILLLDNGTPSEEDRDEPSVPGIRKI